LELHTAECGLVMTSKAILVLRSSKKSPYTPDIPMASVALCDAAHPFAGIVR
jgi:hypothetical protein